ncbi:FAD:protein FMN transferase [Thiocystis violacea]|uniref:FAD:protein FMN transferase n=1 Tax=Thiocystis violacea TaxID=13725 RepID=UPI001904EC72|nr:FAD:protein FMN transferase [Thiocystis violacea]MBK1716150.1 thiamine biosynthesis protein ApbE [Thiocystis violacea]
MRFLSSPSTGFGHRRLILVLLLMSLTLAACREKTPVILARFNAFEAQVDVSLVGVSRDQADQASAILAQDFAYLERDWMTSGGSGAMRRVNQRLARGEPFVAPPSILPLIRLAKTFESDSDGLFNPAIGQLIRLWGFDSAPLNGRPPPTQEQIARLVEAAPAMRQIDIDGLRLTGRNPLLSLDFSAIVKSHAIDLSIQHLRNLGIRNVLIQAGGELRAIGERSGQPWRIPILHPNGSSVMAILSIRGDEGLVTVAEHDRNFMFKGKLYHSIIDPRTGWPAERTRSVTVMHDTATGAAAAARALFIAGPEDWPIIAARMAARYVLLVDLEGRLHMTRAMADRIELVDDQENSVITEPRLGVLQAPGTSLP